jgi:hypothetical protein
MIEILPGGYLVVNSTAGSRVSAKGKADHSPVCRLDKHIPAGYYPDCKLHAISNPSNWRFAFEICMPGLIQNVTTLSGVLANYEQSFWS